MKRKEFLGLLVGKSICVVERINGVKRFNGMKCFLFTK